MNRGLRQPSRGDHHRRGIDLLAESLAAGLRRRARLRLQVEHGLHARHAEYMAREPIHRKLPPRRASPSACSTRSARISCCRSPTTRSCTAKAPCSARCRATTGRSSPTSRLLRLHVGPSRQEAAVHGPGIAQRTNGARRAARLGSARRSAAESHGGSRRLGQGSTRGTCSTRVSTRRIDADTSRGCAVLAPFVALGELLAHEQQLLARIAPHEAVIGAQVGELLPVVARHLGEQRAFAVHDLVVGQRQHEILAERVERARR